MMEDIILSIVKDLLSISIGFVGLVLTAFSILMTLSDDNWKIKKLKQSKKYKDFINSVANLAIGFIVLFIFSIVLLILNKFSKPDYIIIMQIALYLYLLILIVLSIKIITVLNTFKKIIILSADNTKPQINMEDREDES